MSGERETRIRQRAEEIWREEGQPDGRHEAHWYQAVREVDGDDKRAAPLQPRRAARRVAKPRPVTPIATTAAPRPRRPIKKEPT
jgi:hypothetical protein